MMISFKNFTTSQWMDEGCGSPLTRRNHVDLVLKNRSQIPLFFVLQPLLEHSERSVSLLFSWWNTLNRNSVIILG
jgi:hypothetical protein